MPALFEETCINGLVLRNRFVRSATWEGMAEEDGTCTDRLTELMGELAEGRVGLIIGSHTYVSKQGQATPWQLGIYSDRLIPALRRMTNVVHQRGGRIVAQLAHAGCLASPKLTGMTPLAMSHRDTTESHAQQVADRQDLENLCADFAAAARRSQEAGFDGVQIHAAHGYLLSQSLSPHFNRRSDQYGGDLENRARLLLEVLSGVRRSVGRDFPVMVKINSADHIDQGLVLEEFVQVSHMLQAGGIDAIEVSGGTFFSGALNPSRAKIDSEAQEAYFADAARRLKKELRVPVMLVGGIRSITLAERLLAEGAADYFSMSRPFIREPQLIKRWEAGDRRKSTCLSDLGCFKPARAGEGVYCTVEKNAAADR